MNGCLYLHEVIDIVAQGSEQYMAHTIAYDTDRASDAALTLVGTWSVVGATGRWPEVVNLWELPRGWDDWVTLTRATNIRRTTNTTLAGWWSEAYRTRTGGTDRLLLPAPDSPTLDRLLATEAGGEVFVHGIDRVEPGTAHQHLDRLMTSWVPVAEGFGHRLIGAWTNTGDDTEVVSLFACSLNDQARLARSLGEAGRDPLAATGVRSWLELCHRHRVHRHAEVLVPAAGSPLAASPRGEHDRRPR